MHLPGFKPESDRALATEPEIEVRIRALMMDPQTRMPIVVLNDMSGDVVLPIWVGLLEAKAIALEIEKAALPRPMTHDLLRNAIAGLNARVTRVVVAALREDTFYATIWMEQAGEAVALDARPSDAIALALRSDCPIYVSRSVFEHARAAAANTPNASADELRRWLEDLNDDDMGQYKM
jgi:bifunctional DNase/RNase